MWWFERCISLQSLCRHTQKKHHPYFNHALCVQSREESPRHVFLFPQPHEIGIYGRRHLSAVMGCVQNIKISNICSTLTVVPKKMCRSVTLQKRFYIDKYFPNNIMLTLAYADGVEAECVPIVAGRPWQSSRFAASEQRM